MTDAEAHDLAARIHDTFGGPPPSEWVEELLNLDVGTAGTAYARLRREHEGRLSIARYIAVYRGLDTESGRYTVTAGRPDPNAIDLDEYLLRLTRRAVDGNGDAKDELESWKHYLEGGATFPSKGEPGKPKLRQSKEHAA